MRLTHFLIPVAAMVALLGAQTANSQTAAKPKAAPAQAAKPATATKAAGGKEIEGKWKIDHVDVKITSPEGEETKNTVAGDANDFFEISNGTLSSHMMDQDEKIPYSIVGNNILSTQEGKTDTICIKSMTKDKCVLFKKAETPEGDGEFIITLKR